MRRMRALGHVAGVLVLTATPAVAPAAAGTAQGSGGHAPLEGGDRRVEMRSAQSAALTASLAGTFVPICLGFGLALAGESDAADAAGALIMGGGLIIGPFVGYAAGGCPDRGSTGLLIRLGTAVAGMLVASAVAANSSGGFLEIDPAPFIVGGCAAGLILFDDVYDIVCVRGAVGKEWEAKQAGVALRVAPWVEPAGGTVGIGVQLAL
jgi:hypothetical protein